MKAIVTKGCVVIGDKEYSKGESFDSSKEIVESLVASGVAEIKTVKKVTKEK